MNTLLIKLTGEIFSQLSALKNIILQIKELKKNYNLGLVVGGGNIFRGVKQGKELELKPTTSHTAGMVATLINGLVLQDLLEQNSIKTTLFSALQCQSVACVIKQTTINKVLKENGCLIFVGGTGNPFFTTDTTSVLRALQIGSQEVWKGTKVEGIFSADPEQNKESELYKNLTYKQVVEKDLKIMDSTAITLAQHHKIKIRVFNIFEKDALLKAAKDKDFGSTIS